MFGDRVQLRIDFGYDGARFFGLQPQPGRPTAGGALRRRFEAAGAEPKALCFAARTDAGVHARHNVATCWLWRPRDADQVVEEVCRPRDDGLGPLLVCRVPIDVHARAIATGKHYRYRIVDGAAPPVVWKGPGAGDAWRVVPRLDVEAMARAAIHLVGQHDFSAFRSRRCNAPDPVRHLTAVEVTRGREGDVIIDVRGRSFLRHMVRIITGTLAEVGAGLRSSDDVAAVLAQRRRGRAGPTAPACGLTLVRVETRS